MSALEGDALEVSLPLTFYDPQFYEVEFQVLTTLCDAKGNKTIADVCRNFNIDQYDFKDRWNSLLRHNPPAEALRKILAVKSQMDKPLADIARDTEISLGTVRNIVKKLQETADSPHIRTKENMAHRMMNECGGSLKEAKAKLGKMRSPEKKKAVSTEDSNSEKMEEGESEGEKKEEKKEDRKEEATTCDEISDVKIVVDELSCSDSAEVSYLAQLEPLLDDTDKWLSEDFSSEFIPAKAQLTALLQGTDLLRSCKAIGVDFIKMLHSWSAVQSYIPKQCQPAFFYCIIVLSRFGYGVNVIADAINTHVDIVAVSLMNLRIGLGPTHGCSFDVFMHLVRKEPLTSARLSELCGIPPEVSRLLLQRSGSKASLMARLAPAAGEFTRNVLWLYERGIGLKAISAVLRLDEKTLTSAVCGNDEETRAD